MRICFLCLLSYSLILSLIQNGLSKMLDHFPRSTLPRGLIPKKNFPLITPLFLYGYPFSDKEMETFARNHHLLVEHGHLSLSDSDSDSDDRVSKVTEMRPDTLRTSNAVFKYLQEKLGLTSFELTFGAARHKTDDGELANFMIITTNWKCAKLRGMESVFEEDIQKLRRSWRPNEAPMWYNTAVGRSSWFPKHSQWCVLLLPQTAFSLMCIYVIDELNSNNAHDYNVFRSAFSLLSSHFSRCLIHIPTLSCFRSISTSVEYSHLVSNSQFLWNPSRFVSICPGIFIWSRALLSENQRSFLAAPHLPVGLRCAPAPSPDLLTRLFGATIGIATSRALETSPWAVYSLAVGVRTTDIFNPDGNN